MNNINTLKPFQKFCCTIGMIPTSYKTSLTYEEQLLWLCDYLENTVIPTVNNNADAVTELQNLFTELQSYVNNYFDNLDVQQEINNKLDQMAEDGSLQNIMLNYINENIAIIFPTFNDFIIADNLVNNMTIKTLGYYTMNDGGECYYKITNTKPDLPYYITLNNNLYAFILFTNKLNILQLGARPNLSTYDNSLSLINAMSLSNYILIPQGQYYINNDIPILSNKTIEFEPNAIIIKSPTDKQTYFMFDIYKQSNITIINPTLIGDMDTHLNNLGEFGFPIYIAESSNIRIINPNISKAWGDGIYIGLKSYKNPSNTTSDILIDGGNIYNNSRNGITIGTGNNITIKNCNISNSNRVSPKAGIDVEIENDDLPNIYLSNLLIDNCIIENCELGISSNFNKLSGVNINNITYSNINFNNCNNPITYYGGNPTGNLSIFNLKMNNFKTPILFVNKGSNLNTLISNIDIFNKKLSTQIDHYDAAISIDTIDNLNNGNFYINNIILFNENLFKRFCSVMRTTGNLNTTFSDLTLNNIKCNLMNYFLGKTISNIIITNSLFKKITSSSYTLSLLQYNNYLEFNNLTAYTQSAIDVSLPNGIYEFQVMNNNNQTIQVLLNTNLNIIGDNKSTTYTTTKPGANLKFYKNDNDIILLNNLNFTNPT